MDSTVLEYFQRVATQWDTLRSNYYDETVIVKTLDHAPLSKSQTVVDVGTGTGFMAAGLAPLARRVIGVDFSDAMLAVARENMARFELSNVEFRRGDLGRLPLDDATADVVVANMALHHAPDPARALREMARVCRPGGRVVITDALRHPFEWFKTELADVWLGFTHEEIENWFGGAGLSSRRYELIGKR
ncbi:MAG: methyltransferase domain-containing protein [Chloroflexi bacterium]|nr:methyltransferase domain-containing protein [Chloroflexota bacterium]